MANLVRGTQTNFSADFFDFDGAPMLPADAENWPQVVIRDGANTVITTGVGRIVAAGQYQFPWFVPVAATLSTEDAPWTVNWTFVTSEGHTRSYAESFAVVDRIESTPDERQQTYITNAGGTIRALLRWPTQLQAVKLEVRNYSSSGTLLVVDGVATNDLEASACNTQRKINQVAQDGEYVYYYDVGPLSVGEYQFHWIVQETTVSPIDVHVQIGRAVSNLFWHYNVELRTLIDKLQKHVGTVQAYSDSDIYSYILGGLDMLNFTPPSTNWLLADIPLQGSRGVRTALIYCSAIYGLNAQQILEIELSFDHAGQTVTLNYNHDYSGPLGNLLSYLEKFTEAKKSIFRLAQGVAFSGGRVKNYRWTNRVFRLDQALRNVSPPGGAALWQNLGL
jgi:hypothetical protein